MMFLAKNGIYSYKFPIVAVYNLQVRCLIMPDKIYNLIDEKMFSIHGLQCCTKVISETEQKETYKYLSFYNVLVECDIMCNAKLYSILKLKLT